MLLTARSMRLFHGLHAFIVLLTWPFLTIALTNGSAQPNASARYPQIEDVLYRRSFFYAGGVYNDTTNAPNAIFKNQVYVERLTPANVTKENPVLFIHGGGSSGTIWLNTPDGRPGWSSYFMAQGHEVYLIDLPHIGRSPRPGPTNSTVIPLAQLEAGFTATEKSNSSSRIYPQAVLHTQWPGNGSRGDPIFDTFAASQQDISLDLTLLTNLEVNGGLAGCDLLTRIGKKTFIVAHSLGGATSLKIGDACPDLVRGIIGIEPSQNPFQQCEAGPGKCIQNARPWGLTRTRLTYDPPIEGDDPSVALKTVEVGESTPANLSCLAQAPDSVRKLTQLAKIPFLQLQSESSGLVTYAHCEVYYLRQAGASVEWVYLPDRGIKGNGHFMFLEKNSVEIAGIVRDWIDEVESR